MTDRRQWSNTTIKQYLSIWLNTMFDHSHQHVYREFFPHRNLCFSLEPFFFQRKRFQTRIWMSKKNFTVFSKTKARCDVLEGEREKQTNERTNQLVRIVHSASQKTRSIERMESNAITEREEWKISVIRKGAIPHKSIRTFTESFPLVLFFRQKFVLVLYCFSSTKTHRNDEKQRLPCWTGLKPPSMDDLRLIRIKKRSNWRMMNSF